MANMPYQYLPLIPEQQEIRLLTLHPGHISDDIIVSIDHHEFSDAHKPKYEAVSYCWGSLDNLETVGVQEKKHWIVGISRITKQVFAQSLSCIPRHQESLKVTSSVRRSLNATQNLYCALRYLRLADKARVLWVDALCIDQKNLRERSREVGHMGAIYSSAEQVLVWLGPASSDSDVAVNAIEFLSEGLELDGMLLRKFPGSQADLFLKSLEDVSTDNRETALRNFWERPYWSRLWVRQEVRLARRKIAVLGNHQISWEILHKTWRICFELSQKSKTETWDFEHLNPIQQFFDLRSWHICDILIASSMTSYFDPKDILYANISMAAEIKELKIQPDYEKPLALIYKDLFFKYHTTYENLHLMRMCDLRHSFIGQPTFVPDFSRPSSHLMHLAGTAEASFSQKLCFVDANKIILRGIRVSTISNVKARAPSTLNVMETKRVCEEWEPVDLMSAQYCCGGSLLEAYCSTLSRGRGFNYSRTSFVDEMATSTFLKHLWSGRDLDYLNARLPFECFRRIASGSQGSVFFETVDGHIGTSPGDARMGDWICVMPGSSVPLILRPLTDNSSLNQVVAPCYVHGIMFGEAILGPIQKPWICQLDVYDHYEWSMKDNDIKKRTYHDPRLWNLSSGWAAHYCRDPSDCAEDCKEENEDEKKLIRCKFYNKVTKEITWDDPRLTLESLEKHCPALEDIILV